MWPKTEQNLNHYLQEAYYWQMYVFDDFFLLIEMIHFKHAKKA